MEDSAASQIPTVEEARQLQLRGQHAQAEAAYRAILASDASRADVLDALGVLLAQRGELVRAEQLIAKAVALSPGSASYHNNLGNVLQHQNLLPRAEAAFRRAIELRPRMAEAHSNLGHLLAAMRRVDEAINAFHGALALRPDSPATLVGLGRTLLQGGRPGEAIEPLTEAIRLHPDMRLAHHLLATALLEAGLYARAEAAFGALAAAEPQVAEVWCNFGRALIEQDRGDEAIAVLGNALRLEPAFAEAHHNLGTAFLETGAFAEAVASFAQAVQLRPALVPAWRGLGRARLALGDSTGAIAAFERALAIAPGDAETRGGLGLALLTAGEMPRGWHEYEWRWQAPSYRAMRDLPAPLWDGRPVDGALFLHAEQGFGDTIQFVRFASQIAARGQEVIVECQPELTRLIRGIAGIRVTAPGDTLPPMAAHCPLLSIPSRLSVALDTIPARVPYLYPANADVERWKTRLAALPGRVRVGLAWAGNPKRRADRTRSLDLVQLAELLDQKDVCWVSLQVGSAADQAAEFAGRLHDFSSSLQDFAETAALIANLDLVIAADTAVAHLAGAMGKPTWLLLAMGDVWRWMLHRTDSPWYPTLRLFRQTTPLVWEPAIADLTQALRGFLGEHRPQSHLV
jgi:tetratricopeptide (TPR) repeat protein